MASPPHKKPLGYDKDNKITYAPTQTPDGSGYHDELFHGYPFLQNTFITLLGKIRRF